MSGAWIVYSEVPFEGITLFGLFADELDARRFCDEDSDVYDPDAKVRFWEFGPWKVDS